MATQPPQNTNQQNYLNTLINLPQGLLTAWLDYWEERGLPRNRLESLWIDLDRIADETRYVIQECGDLDSELAGEVFLAFLRGTPKSTILEMVKSEMEKKKNESMTPKP